MVTRFEVIDHRSGDDQVFGRGRVYVARDAKITLSYQDGGRTLKVFVDDARALSGEEEVSDYPREGVSENLHYSLVNDVVVSRPATPDELAAAREEASKYGSAMRSCWVCNPAHERFLADTSDNFLFNCIGCGNWFFNGLDITAHSPETEKPRAD